MDRLKPGEAARARGDPASQGRVGAKGRRDDMLLPAGLQLERARSLLADPGDIGTDDIKEFILLSSAREEAERKEREEALERDKAQVAEIKAAQARTGARHASHARSGSHVGPLRQWQRSSSSRVAL